MEVKAGSGSRQCEAQPRYRCKAEEVLVEAEEKGARLRLHFGVPQRALTPGQICAFYEGGRLLGGGVFQKALSE